MKFKMSLLVCVVCALFLGSIAGCDKPTTGGKKPATAPAPGPAPANTTEAK